MLRWLPFYLLVGCSPEGLDLGFDALPGQVDLLAFGPLRWTADGPVVAAGGESSCDAWCRQRDLDGSTRPYTVEAVGLTERGVAIRVPTRLDIELIAWIAHEDTMTWTTRPTLGGAPGRPYAVEAAAWVGGEVLDRDGDEALLRVEQPGLWVEAWFPADDLSPVRQATPTTAAPRDPVGDPTWIRVPATLRDGPNGATIGEIRPTGPADQPDWDTDARPARQIAPAEGDWVPIRVDGAGLKVQAWIHAADQVGPPTEIRGWGSSGGYGFACGGGWYTPQPRLLAGATLFAEPDGAPIGEALDDQRLDPLDLGPDEAGWRWVSVGTPWGDAEVWVREADVEDPR